MADYDLNAIADALAARFAGLDTGQEYTGVTLSVDSDADASGSVNVPALIIELDDITYDVSMGRGADSAVFLGYFLVSNADSPSGQRTLRAMLSSDGVLPRLKDALETDTTLSGAVSYAQMSGTRSIGNINYGGVAYLGAVLEIEVMLQ